MQIYTPTDDDVNVQPQDRCESLNRSIKALSRLNLGLCNKAMYNKSNKAAVIYLNQIFRFCKTILQIVY